MNSKTSRKTKKTLSQIPYNDIFNFNYLLGGDYVQKANISMVN